MSFKGGVARLSELIADLIVGATYKTRETGERIEINTAADSTIRFYSGEAGEQLPSTLNAWSNPSWGGIELLSGSFAADPGRRASIAVATNVATGNSSIFADAERYALSVDGPGSQPYLTMDRTDETGSQYSVLLSGGSKDINVDAREIHLYGTTRVYLPGPLTQAAGRMYGQTENAQSFTFGGWSGGVQADRQGKVVTLFLNGFTALNAKAANDLAGQLPAGWWPRASCYFDAMDGATGNRAPMWVSSDGYFAHVFARAAGEATYGVCTFVVP